MVRRLSLILPLLIILLSGCGIQSSQSQNAPATRQHSDNLFQNLQGQEQQSTQRSEATENPGRASLSLPRSEESTALQAKDSPKEFLIATGHGDLTKGYVTCQRVSDTAARMELAKQIRVLVKEHAIDRVREQRGKPFEQDIEIVREELTNELLKDVKIVDRSLDEATHTCASTAIMPKSHIIPKTQDAQDAKPAMP